MPFLLSVKILQSSHSNVFSWRMYAFLDNTSLFYSCSFIDAVFADLRYAKLIVFIFSGMVWKRTSLTNSASMTPRAECEFKIKNFLRLILYISGMH